MGQVWSPTSSSQFSLFYVFYFIFILLLWYHNDHHHHHPPHPHPDQNANQNDENLPIRAILVGKTFSTPGSIVAPVSSSEQICTLWKSFLEIYIGEHPLPMWQAVWYTGLHLPGRVYGLCLLPNKVRISPGWLLYKYMSILIMMIRMKSTCHKWERWRGSWGLVPRKKFVGTRGSLGLTGTPFKPYKPLLGLLGLSFSP